MHVHYKCPDGYAVYINQYYSVPTMSHPEEPQRHVYARHEGSSVNSLDQ